MTPIVSAKGSVSVASFEFPKLQPGVHDGNRCERCEGTGRKWSRYAAKYTDCSSCKGTGCDPRILKLRKAIRNLHNEVDCRIEHGADSGGHLEYVRDELRRELQ